MTDLLTRPCNIIIITDKTQDSALSELIHLSSEAKVLAIGKNYEDIQKESKDAMKMATVLFCATGTKGTKDVIAPIIEASPNLKWIHSITTGLDHLLYNDLINNPNITITNTKSIFSRSIAEFVVGSMLYFGKDFQRLQKQKELKIWQRFPPVDMHGKTMGIIGYGEIGLACAKLGKAFGMNIIATKKRIEDYHDDYVDQLYSSENYMEVVQQSDYLILAAPLTPETEGMIHSNVLKQSKHGQILINVGRGRLIVESELIECLEQGILGGAALDVFSTEPLPESSKLWTLPNVIISPHNAYQSVDVRLQGYKKFCENCHRFLNNQVLDNVIRKDLGY